MMTALHRSLRFRELTLLRRTLKLRTALLVGFLLLMCLTMTQMTAFGSISDDDLSGMFFGTLLAAFLCAVLTNFEYDADKADEAAGWQLFRRVLPYSGADHAAVLYQFKTGIMLVYGALLFLYSAVISAAGDFPFIGAAVNCYLLSLCTLELSCIVRRSAGMLPQEYRLLKGLLAVPAVLLILIWIPSVLGGMLRTEHSLPGNADPIVYLAAHIGAFYVTLLTCAILCGLLYLGKKVTAAEFDRRML